MKPSMSASASMTPACHWLSTEERPTGETTDAREWQESACRWRRQQGEQGKLLRTRKGVRDMETNRMPLRTSR